MNRINKQAYDKISSRKLTLEEILKLTYPLSQEGINLLKPYLKTKILKKNEFLIRENVRNRNLYIIKEGLVRSYHCDEDRENTLWFATSGDVFCSMRSYFYNAPAVSNIEALMQTELFYIEHDDMEKLFAQSLELANWGRILAFEEIDALEWKHDQLGSGDAYTRYKNFLKMRPKEIITQIPQKHIASYLGITPFTLSRVRLKLLKE